MWEGLGAERHAITLGVLDHGLVPRAGDPVGELALRPGIGQVVTDECRLDDAPCPSRRRLAQAMPPGLVRPMSWTSVTLGVRTAEEVAAAEERERVVGVTGVTDL